MSEHQLLTPETCNIPHVDYRQCPICDGGLAVCARCGEFEAGLERFCSGTKAIAADRVRQYVNRANPSLQSNTEE